jgi:hypothetical protein
MIELLQEHMDALVVAEHLIKIRDKCLWAIEADHKYGENTDHIIEDCYGLATEVLFSAERVVKRHKESNATN